jgi:hypothetical protein
MFRCFELVTTSSDRQADSELPIAAMAALADHPVHVVATYPSGVPDGIVAPRNATVQQFVPHGLLLDRAVCAITHGGMGATQKALARGVPVCVVPHGRDHFEVARRVEVSRCGTRLAAKKLTPRKTEIESAAGNIDDHRCEASRRRIHRHRRRKLRWRCDRATITWCASLNVQPPRRSGDLPWPRVTFTQMRDGAPLVGCRPSGLPIHLQPLSSMICRRQYLRRLSNRNRSPTEELAPLEHAPLPVNRCAVAHHDSMAQRFDWSITLRHLLSSRVQLVRSRAGMPLSAQ